MFPGQDEIRLARVGSLHSTPRRYPARASAVRELQRDLERRKVHGLPDLHGDALQGVTYAGVDGSLTWR